MRRSAADLLKTKHRQPSRRRSLSPSHRIHWHPPKQPAPPAPFRAKQRWVVPWRGCPVLKEWWGTDGHLADVIEMTGSGHIEFAEIQCQCVCVCQFTPCLVESFLVWFTGGILLSCFSGHKRIVLGMEVNSLEKWVSLSGFSTGWTASAQCTWSFQKGYVAVCWYWCPWECCNIAGTLCTHCSTLAPESSGSGLQLGSQPGSSNNISVLTASTRCSVQT